MDEIRKHKLDHFFRGSIILWYGEPNNLPPGWAICNGQNGTPNLCDRFVVGAGRSYTIGNIGGENYHTLTYNEMQSHMHGADGNLNEIGFDTTNGSGGSPVKLRLAMGDNYPWNNIYQKFQTSYAGGNQAHENRPPYYALYYIMKL